MLPLDASLLGPGSLLQRLQGAFTQARGFLERTTAVEVLASFLGEARAAELSGDVRDLDHLGFLVPGEGANEVIGRAAAAAGFASGHTSFPSTVLASELGELRGRRRVPTMVFKACGRLGGGRETFVEAFLPSEEPRVVADWIRRGLGTHVAIRVPDAARFREVQRVFEAAGHRMPPFMNGRPMHNPAEQVSLIYFDHEADGRRLRLEFIHPGEV